MAMEKMLAGLSTRGYPAGLEPVGEQVAEKSSATSKSAVSRRFVAMTETALAELLSQDLSHDDAGPTPAATEASITRFAELVARAVVAGYRNQQNGQPLGDVSRRPLSIESLLDGRVLDEWTLWEVANRLFNFKGAVVISLS
jgi:hypothetical protein